MPKTLYPNALYALLQVRSLAVTETSGHTILPTGPHLRHRGGLRLAALGLAAEHGTSTFALSGVSAVPIAIAVSQRAIPAKLAELEVLTTLRHKGRSIMVTSMEAYRPGDRSERLAFGTLTWSILPPSANGGTPAIGQVAPEGDLLDVTGIRAEGAVTSIQTADPGLLGPGGVLHAGALQALAEEAALAAVRHQAPGEAPPVLTDATFHFIRAARAAPFITQVRAQPGGDVEVSIYDDGGAGRLCVLCTCTVSTGAQR